MKMGGIARVTPRIGVIFVNFPNIPGPQKHHSDIGTKRQDNGEGGSHF